MSAENGLEAPESVDIGQILQQIATEPKPWWRSRTIIGLLVVVIAQIIRAAGHYEVDTAALADAVSAGLDIVGLALAWWGRVAASRPISRAVLPGVGDPDRAVVHDVQPAPQAAAGPGQRIAGGAVGGRDDPRGIWGQDG